MAPITPNHTMCSVFKESKCTVCKKSVVRYADDQRRFFKGRSAGLCLCDMTSMPPQDAEDNLSPSSPRQDAENNPSPSSHSIVKLQPQPEFSPFSIFKHMFEIQNKEKEVKCSHEINKTPTAKTIQGLKYLESKDISVSSPLHDLLERKDNHSNCSSPNLDGQTCPEFGFSRVCDKINDSDESDGVLSPQSDIEPQLQTIDFGVLSPESDIESQLQTIDFEYVTNGLKQDEPMSHGTPHDLHRENEYAMGGFDAKLFPLSFDSELSQDVQTVLNNSLGHIDIKLSHDQNPSTNDNDLQLSLKDVLLTGASENEQLNKHRGYIQSQQLGNEIEINYEQSYDLFNKNQISENEIEKLNKCQCNLNMAKIDITECNTDFGRCLKCNKYLQPHSFIAHDVNERTTANVICGSNLTMTNVLDDSFSNENRDNVSLSYGSCDESNMSDDSVNKAQEYINQDLNTILRNSKCDPFLNEILKEDQDVTNELSKPSFLHNTLMGDNQRIMMHKSKPQSDKKISKISVLSHPGFLLKDLKQAVSVVGTRDNFSVVAKHDLKPVDHLAGTCNKSVHSKRITVLPHKIPSIEGKYDSADKKSLLRSILNKEDFGKNCVKKKIDIIFQQINSSSREKTESRKRKINETKSTANIKRQKCSKQGQKKSTELPLPSSLVKGKTRRNHYNGKPKTQELPLPLSVRSTKESSICQRPYISKANSEHSEITSSGVLEVNSNKDESEGIPEDLLDLVLNCCESFDNNDAHSLLSDLNDNCGLEDSLNSLIEDHFKSSQESLTSFDEVLDKSEDQRNDIQSQDSYVKSSSLASTTCKKTVSLLRAAVTSQNMDELIKQIPLRSHSDASIQSSSKDKSGYKSEMSNIGFITKPIHFNSPNSQSKSFIKVYNRDSRTDISSTSKLTLPYKLSGMRNELNKHLSTDSDSSNVTHTEFSPSKLSTKREKNFNNLILGISKGEDSYSSSQTTKKYSSFSEISSSLKDNGLRTNNFKKQQHKKPSESNMTRIQTERHPSLSIHTPDQDSDSLCYPLLNSDYTQRHGSSSVPEHLPMTPLSSAPSSPFSEVYSPFLFNAISPTGPQLDQTIQTQNPPSNLPNIDVSYRGQSSSFVKSISCDLDKSKSYKSSSFLQGLLTGELSPDRYEKLDQQLIEKEKRKCPSF